MSDADPRGRKPFEPPPWEREQFEELARRREAVQETPVEAPAEPQAAAAPPAERAEVPPAAEAPAEAPATVGGPTPAAEPATAEVEPALDRKVVDAMLLELAGEHGSALAPARKVSKGLAVALLMLAVFLVVLALVTGVRSAGGGALGAIGASVVAVFGLGIGGVAVWLWIRANKGQGS